MKIDISKLSKLANIPLKQEEKEKLEQQLIVTLNHVKRLQELKTDNIIPTDQVTGLTNITREDNVEVSLSQTEALKNAKNQYNGFFVVPAILDN